MTARRIIEKCCKATQVPKKSIKKIIGSGTGMDEELNRHTAAVLVASFFEGMYSVDKGGLELN